MSLLFPAALGLLALAVPIVFLYLLRLRRQEIKTSSTLLWQQLAVDRSANAPWQKLHRNILLFIQLLVLAALVFALARPVLRSSAGLDGSVIVLLDVSASMTATDEQDGLSRLDAAVRQVDRLIDNLGSNDAMTLITVGHNPGIVAPSTGDKSQLRELLSIIEPESGSADWPGAFELAAGLAKPLSDPQMVIITDGGLMDNLPPLPVNVNYIPVGHEGDNLAISAHGMRPLDRTTELLVGVTNFGHSIAQASANLYVDGNLFDSRAIEIHPQDTIQFSWMLPEGASTVETRLVANEGSPDFLSIDNEAWGVVNNQPNRRVLLVSEGNMFIERLFTILPGYEVTRSSSIGTEADSPDELIYDLYILDGVPVPDPLPNGNILIIDPQPPADQSSNLPPITVSGIFTNTGVTRLVNDPLLENVNWHDVSIAEARHVSASSLTPLIESTGGSLLLAGEYDGRRVVILPFDLAASDLPLQIAFPVLMANITEWLNPGRVFLAEENYQPGAIVSLATDPHAKGIVVKSPNGDVWEQALDESTKAGLNYRTNETGIYSVSFVEESGELSLAGRFGVNLIDAAESNIIPKESLQLGQTTIPSYATTPSHKEFWPVLLVATLLLLSIEWWLTYRRGIKLPFPKLR